MDNFEKRRFGGRWPERAVLAAAGLAAALVVHGAVLGLFHGRSAQEQLLASPALEQRLAECRANSAGRSELQQCQLAVAEGERRARAATQVAQR